MSLVSHSFIYVSAPVKIKRASKGINTRDWQEATLFRDTTVLDPDSVMQRWAHISAHCHGCNIDPSKIIRSARIGMVHNEMSCV